ncbi:MAG: SGNH/GDSL hydrolase family protein, partial [Myxococcota bacterium]
MVTLHRLFASVSASIVLTLGASPAFAFSDVFVFGDSLSDAGAFTYLFGGLACPAAPYDGCRFSNGPTWVENFATALGNSADTAYAPGGGTNYAIGGERSDELLGAGVTGDASSGIGQIPLFSSDVSGVADPNALYVIWAGG